MGGWAGIGAIAIPPRGGPEAFRGPRGGRGGSYVPPFGRKPDVSRMRLWTRTSVRFYQRLPAPAIACSCCELRRARGRGISGEPHAQKKPEWWIENDIYEAHERYQARHGGKTKASVHHAIPRSRIAQWHDQWEQVAIFFRPETRASVGASATRWRKEWSPEQPSVLRRNQGPKVLHRAAVLQAVMLSDALAPTNPVMHFGGCTWNAHPLRVRAHGKVHPTPARPTHHRARWVTATSRALGCAGGRGRAEEVPGPSLVPQVT